MLFTQSVLWESRLRERNEGLLSHLPASSHMCLVGLFLLHAVIAKGWHFPIGLSHAAGLFSPFAWLETIGGHYGPLRVLRPAGRDVERYASLYTCGFLSHQEREEEEEQQEEVEGDGEELKETAHG